MDMVRAYRHPSSVGDFEIRQEHVFDGVFWFAYGCGERLGRYATAQVAVDEVSSGGCDWPGVVNPGDLGISDDLSDWTPIRA
tara:strand:+ start:1767 stop:2012 length:246 start_codon:yes stop_codon:yes gene_type:complete